jgi:hypothetical protein
MSVVVDLTGMLIHHHMMGLGKTLMILFLILMAIQ